MHLTTRTLPRLAVCLIGAAAMLPGVAHAASPATSTPAIADVQAIGATDAGPAFVASSTGLYRATAPYTHWSQENAVPSIVIIAPRSDKPDDLIYGTTGGTLFRSTDGGAHATQLPLNLGGDQGVLVRAVGDPSTLYAAAAANESGSIYKSTDDGRTWKKVESISDSTGLGSAGYSAIAVDPQNAAHILVAEYAYHFGALSESKDGGRTFHDLPSPNDPNFGVNTAPNMIGINPVNPADLWVQWDSWLYHSRDGGRSWTLGSKGLPDQGAVTHIAIAAHTGAVYLATQSGTDDATAAGIYWSRDGTQFAPLAPSLTAHDSEVAVIAQGRTLLLGSANQPFQVLQLAADGSAGTLIPLIVTALPSTGLGAANAALFVSSGRGIYALDTRSGAVLKSFAGTADSVPAVARGVLYFTVGHTAQAVVLRTGAQLWSVSLQVPASDPVVLGDSVYFATANQQDVPGILALDALSGQQRWQWNAPGDHSALVTVRAAGGMVYAGAEDTGVYGLDARTGAQRWHALVHGGGTTQITVADGFVYAGTDTVGPASDQGLHALDAATGAERWRLAPNPSNEGTFAPTSVVGGVLAVSTPDGIVGVDAQTGKRRWQIASLGEMDYTVPTAAGGMVLVYDNTNVLHAIDSQSGAQRWTFRAAGSHFLIASPLLLGTVVYLPAANYRLYALDAASGRQLWSFEGETAFSVQSLWQALPTDLTTPAGDGTRYFPQTGHSLGGPFLAFWQQHGGLATFGYPLSEPFVENGLQAQFTERFELQLAGGRVTVAPLGKLLTSGRTFPPGLAGANTADAQYFPATGHTVSGRFLRYWQAHEGALLLGAPISEVVVEGNGDGSGRRYQVQWFTNGRLEYHPELGRGPFEMEIGLVGRQALLERGWLS